MLYQLSYFRNVHLAKVGTFSFLGQGCALPTELFPLVLQTINIFRREEEETRTPTSQLTLPPQSSASTNSATSPTLDNAWIKKSAQNRTRTCTPRGTRTWNVRVYQFRHLGILSLRPNVLMLFFVQHVERKTGLGPATPTLARLCSTNWAISACSFRLISLDGVCFVIPAGFKPTTFWSVVRCSIQLSYGTSMIRCRPKIDLQKSSYFWFAGAKVITFCETAKLFRDFFQKKRQIL